MEQFQAEIITAFGTLLSIIIGYAVSQLKAYLTKKGILAELENKKGYVDIVVKAVQQLYAEADGDVKLAEAKKQLIEIFNKNGVNFTEDELNMLIEAAVKGMKDGAKAEVVKIEDKKGK